MSEIIATKRLVHRLVDSVKLPFKYHCECLRGDLLDDDETEQAKLADTEDYLVVLASSVAARAVTLQRMKCVVIHPHMRTSVLHSSGIMSLEEERIDPELEAQKGGRSVDVSSHTGMTSTTPL